MIIAIGGIMNYFEQIKERLSSQLGVDKNKITMDTLVMEDLGADSLDLVELFMTIEDELDIAISDEDAVNIKTIGDLVAILEKYSK